MLDVNTITDDRQMRALTGLDMVAFCALAAPFAQGCQQEADARFTDQCPRKRKAGGGRKGVESIKKCGAVRGQPPAVLTWEPISVGERHVPIRWAAFRRRR